MHSPLASPSIPLRAISHVHGAYPHLPRTTSYFTPPPSSPLPSRYAHSSTGSGFPAQPYHSPSNHTILSPHSPSGQQHREPFSTANIPDYPSPREQREQRYAQAPVRPPMAPRRTSIRASAIPLTPKITDLSTLEESRRRRPSFKIELPPRASEDVMRTHQSQTPFPSRAYVAQATANNTALNAHVPAQQDTAEAEENEFIILHQAQGATPAFYQDYPSPADPWSGAGLVGLGYTLNKLRAPTPWVRPGPEGEWLNEHDLEELDSGMTEMRVV